ncbi:MAG: glycoside hydrolase family 3 N-terminal domain-containing protein, partial [Vampirovibrionia bacterium]
MSDYQSVEHIIEALTLKEKLSQLFVVGYWGSSIPDDLVDWANNSLGGLIFFSENITSTSQIKSLITDIQQQSSLKLFMSVDQEGGFVERIKGAIQIPTAMALSASGDLDNVAIAASILSEELKSLGFNLNFAPVLDVNTNPDNPIIGI